GVFQMVPVVGGGLVSIAEVHAIVARAHLAQGEPEMARDRFRFLERNWFLNRHWEAAVVGLPAKPRSLASSCVSLRSITLELRRGSRWPRHGAPCASEWPCVRPAHGFLPIPRGCKPRCPWARTCSAGARRNGSTDSANKHGSCCCACAPCRWHRWPRTWRA